MACCGERLLQQMTEQDSDQTDSFQHGAPMQSSHLRKVAVVYVQLPQDMRAGSGVSCDARDDLGTSSGSTTGILHCAKRHETMIVDGPDHAGCRQ